MGPCVNEFAVIALKIEIMARVATKKVSSVATKNNADKLTTVGVLGQVVFESINVRENINGKKYVATPQGAVYAKIDEIETGIIYSVVELSNGALALNRATPIEKMNYLNGLKSEYPNLSITDIKDMLGIQ